MILYVVIQTDLNHNTVTINMLIIFIASLKSFVVVVLFI